MKSCSQILRHGIAYIGSSQSVVSWPAALALLEDLLEIQIVGLQLRHTDSETPGWGPTLFSRGLQGSWCTFRFENHWFTSILFILFCSSTTNSKCLRILVQARSHFWLPQNDREYPVSFGIQLFQLDWELFCALSVLPFLDNKTFVANAPVSHLLLLKPKGKLATWKLTHFSWTKTFLI